jgi:hypothetical protein
MTARRRAPSAGHVSPDGIPTGQNHETWQGSPSLGTLLLLLLLLLFLLCKDLDVARYLLAMWARSMLPITTLAMLATHPAQLCSSARAITS